MRSSLLLWTLIGMHAIAAAAGFLAPYSYREQHRRTPGAPPTELTWMDGDGRVRLHPHVRLTDGRVVPLRLFVRGSEYRWLGSFPSSLHLFGVDAPGRVFLLGTDSLGRDNFSRLLYGGQLTLMAGLLGAGLALTLAVLFGTAAGYSGGAMDAVTMWSSDLFLSLPWLYLLLAARAFLPLDLAPEAAFVSIVILLGLLGWAAPTRIVRNVVRGVKVKDHVVAAKSAGAGHLRVLWFHVLPQTLAPIAVQAALLVPAYMLAEVTLSFVGLGIGEPRPSWGTMLAEASRAGGLSARPWLLAPAVTLAAVTLLYHQTLGRLGASAEPSTQGTAGGSPMTTRTT